MPVTSRHSHEVRRNVRITEATTFVVENPPPHFGGLYWIFVKLTSDSGVSGYGEAYSVPFHPRVVTQMIEDRLANVLVPITSPYPIVGFLGRRFDQIGRRSGRLINRL